MKKSKKIILYTHEFPPFLGGLATTSLKLARGMREAGLEVTVLAPQYSKDDKEIDRGFDFRVVRMGRLARNHGVPSPIKEIKGFVSLKGILSQIRPDVVLFITREAHAAGGLLPGFSYKVLVRTAGYEAKRYLLGKKITKRLLGISMKRLYMHADRIISPSRSTVELLKKAGIPNEKLEVIYNGVDPKMLDTESSRGIQEELRSKLGIRNDEKVALTLARLVPGKGQDTVIKAMPRVLDEFSGFKYLIVGEGNYERELKKLADKHGVSSNVVFAGPVPHSEVSKYYDLCDIFVMCNRTVEGKENIEGLPNVVLEAASRRRPVITGVLGGAKEAVEHGKTGYVVDGEKTDEIAKYLLDLLSNAAKARDFGIAGRRRIEEIFTEEKMIKEYLRVIESS